MNIATALQRQCLVVVIKHAAHTRSYASFQEPGWWKSNIPEEQIDLGFSTEELNRIQQDQAQYITGIEYDYATLKNFPRNLIDFLEEKQGQDTSGN